MRSTRIVACALALVGMVGCARTPPARRGEGPQGAGSAAPVTDAEADFLAEAEVIRGMGASPDWKEVAERLQAFVGRHPRFALGWYNLGVAYQELGEGAKAADAYRRAVAADEQLRPARLNLATLAVGRGDHDEAVRVLERLVQTDPGAVFARLALANYKLAESAFSDAERLAKEALGRSPEAVDGYCVLAQVYRETKDLGRARLVVAQGLKLDAKAACLHLALGRILVAQGDTAAAVTSFERAVEIDPSLSEARFLVAQISMRFKNFGRAVQHLKAIVESEPDPGVALVNLGVAYKGAGQFEEAEKTYLDAARSPTAEAAARFNLGVLYLRHLDRLDDAEASFRRFVELSPGEAGQADVLLSEVEQLKRFKAQEAAMAEESAREAELEPEVETPPIPGAESEAESPVAAEPEPRPKVRVKRRSKKKKPKKDRPPPPTLAPDDFE